MLIIKGNLCENINQIYGVATREKLPFYKRNNRVLVTNDISKNIIGYKAIITTECPVKKSYLPIIVGNIGETEIPKINNNDIVIINKYGEIRILWDAKSPFNSLFITDSCNCCCVICPQPPLKHDERTIEICYNILNLLKKTSVPNICITGGEPTNVKTQFLQIIKRCSTEHPESLISVLTNGIKFSNLKFCSEVLSYVNQNFLFCISLHSDVDVIHDTVVGVKGSFTKTQAGIYNIAKFKIPIEIRFVINKMNYERILEFANYIYRYFPFVRHIAFMSLELCGLAEENTNLVYLDPVLYKNELRNAVIFLYRRGMYVSIYNTPLCLIHPDVHKFAAKSISRWKNYYIDICSNCQKKNECCGLFSTSTKIISHHLMNFS
jgi:His-Xaa-Ser system radical SAM maturase HxsC